MASLISTTLPRLIRSTNEFKRVAATGVTRPNDTNTYAAGDVITNSTSAGSATAFTFSNVVRKAGGSGTIVAASLLDSANQTLKLLADLWLFHTLPGLDGDNAAFTPTDAEMDNVVAVLPFSAYFVGDATSGAGGNVRLIWSDIPRPFTCASGVRDLYGVLVARNAYVPVAQEIFTPKLGIFWD